MLDVNTPAPKTHLIVRAWRSWSAFQVWKLPFITTCVLASLLGLAMPQERNERKRAMEYLNFDPISEMRISTSQGGFDAPIRHSVIVPTDRALKILKLVGEAKACEWPDDIDSWQECIVMTVAHADTGDRLQVDKLQRVSVFMRIQSRSPHLVVIGLRCFMIANKPDESLLCNEIYNVAEIQDPPFDWIR